MSDQSAPITVKNTTGENAIREDDRPVFNKAMDIALRHAASATVQSVMVVVCPRGVYITQPDWLEYAVVIRYISPDRNPLTIGVIQRQPGAAVECHS